MERSEIRDTIITILKKFTRRLPRGLVIGDNTSLLNDLNIDSADMVDLVLTLEERFGIAVPDSALNELRTVGQTIDFVQQSLPSSIPQGAD